MKILLLIHQLGIGGAENMVFNLAKELISEQHDVKIICSGSKMGNKLEKKVEEVCYINYLNLDGKVTLKSYFEVYREIKKQAPDVVHAHLGGVTYAVPVCSVMNIPLVITAHTKPEVAFSKKIMPFLKLAMRYRKCRMVAVSEQHFLQLNQYFGGSSDKYTYVNNGIDLTRFYKKYHSNFVFINVARQDENKNQIAILNCFRAIYEKYRHIKLYLVGDGPCHDSLRETIEEYGLTEAVFMPGNVSNVEDYYAMADVYVQASHREALPLTTLEAMASGLPIISTDVGGMRDIVKENGILLADGDDSALKDAMIALLKLDEMQLTNMGNISKDMVKEYSASAMGKKYIKVYQSILNKK